MRRWVWLACALAGCDYPEFGFRADAADDATFEDAPSDTTEIDDAAEDASVDETTPDTAALETSAPDTSASDTSLDAKPDAPTDTAPKTGCAASTALFCEDWDGAKTAQENFGGTSVSPTGTIAIDKKGPLSTPNVFLASVSPGASPGVVLADVWRVFDAPAADTTLRVDAWIKLETVYPTTSGSAFLLKMERPGGLGDGVTFSIDKAGFYADRIAMDYDRWAITSVTPKIGAWFHVRIDAKLHTTNGAITVWIDDMSKPVLTKTGISTAAMDDTHKQLIVGLYAEGLEGTYNVRYDDVSFSFK